MRSPAPAERRARRARWLWLVGVGTTVILLWWALRDVSAGDVIRELRQARAGPLLGTVVLATLTFPLRALRWRVMLTRADARPPLGALWHAVAIGFMANNVLPARAGEVARAFVGGRLAGIRVTTALGSVVLERALDGVALVALMLIPLATHGEATVGGRDLVPLLRLMAGVFGGALVVAMALATAPRLATRLARRVSAALLPRRWSERVTELIEGALAGLAALRSPQLAIRTLGWTAAIWLVNAASFWLAFSAFNVTTPWTAAFLVQGLIAIGVAIPSAPGFFGPFEAATRAALALYGVAPAVAVSYAVGYHIATFLPITLLGLWSLRRAAHLRLGDLARVRAEGTPG